MPEPILFEPLSYQLSDNGVAFISIDVKDRPVNVLTPELHEAIGTVADHLASDDDAIGAVLHSGKSSFMAGGDLKRIVRFYDRNRTAAEAYEQSRAYTESLRKLETCGKPVAVAINGTALGGGLELALACDLRVAGENARLGLPEAGLGLVPGAGGTQRLPRICGEAAARRLILGAEVVDGTEAARLGLVQWVVPDDQLADWTQTLVARLGSLPGPALAACKSCIAASFDGSPGGYDRELQVTRELHGLAETQRRIQAFLERAS